MLTAAVISTALALFHVGFAAEPTVTCLTPLSPLNGQAFLYGGGQIVKYVCNPGYKLYGDSISKCFGSEWAPDVPTCVAMEPIPQPSTTEEDFIEESIPSTTRPLFKWNELEPEKVNKTTVTNSSDSDSTQSDEARLHMVLYPERQHTRRRRPVMITSTVRTARVQSGSELEAEERKRSASKKERTTTTVQVETPSVVYVRRALTPGKASAQEQALRQQYNRAALHMIVDNNGVQDNVRVVSMPRAAVSQDDKGGQSEETLRHMYWMAQNMYPRQAALVDRSNGNPVVMSLSESQMAWINSLHPELRERYLKDLYVTRAKEAEEGARAQAFLRRYEDTLSFIYNRPYYVREPLSENYLSMVVENQAASFDYTCYQSDEYGRAHLIRAPALSNAHVFRYDRKRNTQPPQNDYLTVEYRCNPGYLLQDSLYNTLYCSQRGWVGTLPNCVPNPRETLHKPILPPKNTQSEEASTRRSCSFNNGICSQICTENGNGDVLCECQKGYRLANNRRDCLDVNECLNRRGGCKGRCYNEIGSYRCACNRGYRLAQDKKSCLDIDECFENNFGCSHRCINVGGSAYCICPPGFILNENRKTCQDLDECSIEGNRCQHKCHNTIGNYTCSCLSGYVLVNHYYCEGCRKNSYRSKDDELCTECPTNSFTETNAKTSISDCICYHGYIGKPSRNIPCRDVNECAEENFGCSHDCVNTPGSAHCSCPVGYQLQEDKKTCVDVNECSVKNGGCQEICENSEGSFKCSCSEGYSISSDPYSCDDVDECAENNGGCSHQCVNFPGGYFCSCDNASRLDSGQKNCVAVRCPRVPQPLHATINCYTHSNVELNMNDKKGNEDFAVGTTCTFKCNKGHKAIFLPGTITCKEDSLWTGSPPTCLALQCPPLQIPKNGNVQPQGCIKGHMDVLEKCYFTCDAGYRLVGKPVATCRRNRLWLPRESPICQPITVLPHIKCPDDINLELPTGNNSMHWRIPTPESNVDLENIQMNPNWAIIGSFVSFPAGITEIKFIAKSATAENVTAQCIWTVNILDKEPPLTYNCPESFNVVAGSVEGATVSWNEPIFTDNVMVTSIVKTLEPNSTVYAGVHIVEYTVKDAVGNIGNCAFLINVTRTDCGSLTGPLNGHLICTDWALGIICEPTCDLGYMRYSLEPSYFICDDSGTWQPSNTIQECTHFVPTPISGCLPGFEFRIFNDTGEEICIECPSGQPWSLESGTCTDLQSLNTADTQEVYCDHCETTTDSSLDTTGFQLPFDNEDSSLIFGKIQ